MNIFLCEVKKSRFRFKKYLCRKEKTNLKFRIWDLGFVSLEVYDILSKEIKSPVYGIKNGGSYKAVFNGSILPGGIYYHKIASGKFSQLRKMILIK